MVELIRAANNITDDSTDATDAVGEGCMRVWKNYRTYRISLFYTWLLLPVVVRIICGRG
ncbi:MAG: sigma-70 family RNA polymerase sigma factor [Desulfovibrio sp.]|nr:sigma-70 family RNA polymerase sigma factor [Desulfovibrio sp.]